MHIAINGGGLVGALAAIYMLKHAPNKVTVFEKRSDIRKATAETGRSINLILTSRGLYALRNIGLDEEALKLCVPVKGRMMHDKQGKTTFQPYGVSDKEVNYSVSRTALNALLIDIAERRGAKFVFDVSLDKLDFATGEMRFIPASVALQQKPNSPPPAHTLIAKADIILGTDGVASQVRTLMLAQLQQDGVKDATFTPEFLGISYKELTFPKGADGGYCMNGDALHIWPRGPHFLMGLADQRSTFTGTLYLPDGLAPLTNIPGVESVPTFEQLGSSVDKYKAYIAEHMPDLPALVPDCAEQLASRPHSFLATVRCSHWHYKGKVVLVGDSAHGVVPFFGQGMNLGFESVAVLDKLLTSMGPKNAEAAFRAFTAYHKKSATAIANMAIENFAEMSYKVGQAEFLQRKAIENFIEAKHSTLLRSRYYLITKTLVPYKTAQEAGVLIDKCVTAIVEEMGRKGVKDIKDFPDARVVEIINANLTPFITERGIQLADPLREYYEDGLKAMMQRVPKSKL